MDRIAACPGRCSLYFLLSLSKYVRTLAESLGHSSRRVPEEVSEMAINPNWLDAEHIPTKMVAGDREILGTGENPKSSGESRSNCGGALWKQQKNE